MEDFLRQFAGVGVILIGGAFGLLAWFLRVDRGRILDQMAELGRQIEGLTRELARQRDELHKAILAHESRLAAIEGALRFGRRATDKVEPIP